MLYLDLELDKRRELFEMRKADGRPALREFALPGQLLAWYLILLPLSSYLLNLSTPVSEGAMARVRLFAIGGDALLHPLVGLFLGTFLASHFQQNRLRRLYATLTGLLGLALILVIPFFVLDAVQIRQNVNPQMLRLYDLNLIRALGVFLVVGVVLLVLSVMVWRALRRDRKVALADKGEANPTLVGSALRSGPDA